VARFSTRERCSQTARAKAGAIIKHVSPYSIVSIALLAVGLAVRAALYFPPAMFQIDSDAVIAGLCAFHIAHGQHPVFFPGGYRLGAASCYLTAAYFHLFGPQRIGLALTGLTWGAFYLVFSLLFLRAALGPKSACIAFLFAVVPSEQFMTVTYPPWGYGEIMASCAATLWLAVLWRREGALWQRACFGLSVGIGLWFSLQTLMIVLPAIAWIALRRRAAILKEAIPAVATAAAGAVPLLVGNLAAGFPTFTQNWASRTVPSIAAAWDNFVWLLSYMLPKLLFRSSGWWSETTVLIVAYAIAAIGFAVMLRRNAPESTRPYSARELGLLLLFVFIASVALFSISQAGTFRGWTVRYIAPLYAVVPIFLGLGVEGLWSVSRAASVLTVAALLIPNLLCYGLPGSSLRAQLTTELSDYTRLERALVEHRIGMVYGDYTWVYDLNFDTHEQVAAVPKVPVVDYFDYGGELGTAPVRWAAIGAPDELRQEAASARAHGMLEKYGQLWLFVADRPAPDAARLLAALRSNGI
jgi:hypothetical protein